jgi:hypothetical protein
MLYLSRLLNKTETAAKKEALQIREIRNFYREQDMLEVKKNIALRRGQ